MVPKSSYFYSILVWPTLYSANMFRTYIAAMSKNQTRTYYKDWVMIRPMEGDRVKSVGANFTTFFFHFISRLVPSFIKLLVPNCNWQLALKCQASFQGKNNFENPSTNIEVMTLIFDNILHQKWLEICFSAYRKKLALPYNSLPSLCSDSDHIRPISSVLYLYVLCM